MKQLSMLKNTIDENVQTDCMVCPLAKQCRLKFPSSITHTTKMFQLVHLDVWGPHKDPTYDRKHYFLTIVDDFSRFTWITLLQSKKDVVVVLKSFIAMICNQFDCSIKILRSDNGTEFF
uniref:Putative ovule protein n=1 Tax=Solanum chacoense TaxID=4108 RepID=A0A0V0GNR6_SOLCH